MHPDLLKEETDALNSKKLNYKIDKIEQNKGKLVIYVEYKYDDKTYHLKCCYPAAYPYFPPEIFSEDFSPGRHVDPYSKKVCLYEDENSAWDPERDTLANSLCEQLPFIFQSHKNPGKPAENEGRVGYQITGQIPYETPSVIFVEDGCIPDGNKFGGMELRTHKDIGPKAFFSGYIKQLSSNNEILYESNSVLGELYPKNFHARWVRLDAPPASITGNKILSEAIEFYPSIKTPNFKNKDIDIVGLLFPEEDEYLNVVLNWIFVIRRRIKRGNNKRDIRISVIRSDRFNSESFHVRTPRLKELINKKVVVVGAGALGSQITWQLARAGVRSIHIIDYDIVQAGNAPRWLLGFSAIGYQKVNVVAGFLRQNYPDIDCVPVILRIGHNTEIDIDGTLMNEHEYLSKLINDADLLVDAAAESNISLYLSNLCKVNLTSYLWATGTQGAWGGIVGRVIPKITEGTWTDFSYHYSSGSISSPPAEEGSDVQPVGCFHSTFTGAGFDMDEISLLAARLAVSTILKNSKDGYPDFKWDIGVLHLWDQNDVHPVEPKWYTYKLLPNDK